MLKLLHPKWLVLHVLTVAACVIMILLGQWQWRVAHQHHGDIRYYAYAFQWWAFVGFALLMWFRIILDYRRKPAVDAADRAAAVAERPVTGSRYLAYSPPAVPAFDADPERRRFNAYLARLNATEPAAARPQTANRESAE